jgi:hypothetical protein
MYKHLSALLLFLVVLFNTEILVEASSPVIITIITSPTQHYGVLFYYKTSVDAQTQEGVYIDEHGNQTYTINGIIMSVEVSPRVDFLGGKLSEITLKLVRNNKVLYSTSSSNGNWLKYDYLKNPLPQESLMDQIPAFPVVSIIVGVILGAGILYKRNQRCIKS